MQMRPRVSLTPGTKLAERFPHLVKKEVPHTHHGEESEKRCIELNAQASTSKRRRRLPFDISNFQSRRAEEGDKS